MSSKVKTYTQPHLRCVFIIVYMLKCFHLGHSLHMFTPYIPVAAYPGAMAPGRYHSLLLQGGRVIAIGLNGQGETSVPALTEDLRYVPWRKKALLRPQMWMDILYKYHRNRAEDGETRVWFGSPIEVCVILKCARTVGMIPRFFLLGDLRWLGTEQKGWRQDISISNV